MTHLTERIEAGIISPYKQTAACKRVISRLKKMGYRLPPNEDNIFLLSAGRMGMNEKACGYFQWALCTQNTYPFASFIGCSTPVLKALKEDNWEITYGSGGYEDEINVLTNNPKAVIRTR